MYLLSSDICLLALCESSKAPRQLALAERFQSHSVADIAICSVVHQELLFQARNSRHATENLGLVRAFLEPVVSLPFDERCAEETALLRSRLKQRIDEVSPCDLFTVACARAFDTILVVDNLEKFRLFNDVRMEVW